MRKRKTHTTENTILCHEKVENLENTSLYYLVIENMIEANINHQLLSISLNDMYKHIPYTPLDIFREINKLIQSIRTF